MKNLKTKVILSGIVLVFALIATIGSTFAWFTVAQSVEVQSMELNVQAADSMLVKVWETDDVQSDPDLSTPSNYSTTLTNQDFIDAGFDFTGGGTSPWTLQPVTAIKTDYLGVDVVNLNDMLANDSNLTRNLTSLPTSGNESTEVNAAGGKYIELKLWVLSQSTTSQDVVLQDLMIETIDSNSDDQDDIIYAVRIGVYDESVSNSENIFGLDTDYNYDFGDYPSQPGFSQYAWDNNSADSVTPDDDFNALDELTSAYIDQSADNNKDWYASGSDQASLSAITAGAATDSKTAADSIFTTPAAGNPLVPTLVTFKIYVEGWDFHTNNDVISAGFEISFKFAFKNL